MITKAELQELLPRLESLLELSVIKKKPVFVSILREELVSNYPYTAIRELLLNACMHRDLQSNTPLRFYEYAGHLEILNAGGLYGNARPENFPRVNDYRNPLIASAMKTMGYVNMFNRGVGQVQTDLKENGNPPAEFDVNLITAFKVDVKVVPNYVIENGCDGGKIGGKDGGNVPIIELTNFQKDIIDLIQEDSTISINRMAVKLAVKKRTLEREIANIKQKGYISRIGSPRSGQWKVNFPYTYIVEII